MRKSKCPPWTGPHKLCESMRELRMASVFKIRDQGIVDPRGGRKGDLLVQVFIEVPKKLNSGSRTSAT